MALQHLRSNTASKRPTAGAMSDGQIAINTNATSPGLFFKDAGGSIIKVGPVHVGTTAPNSSPAGSTGNSLGEQWLDTSGGGYVLKIWDGSAWRSEVGEFVDAAGDTMTGALILPSGTAAAPALGVGSTDNGLYSPGTDQVAISTNGTGRLFVDSSGRVGINNSSMSSFTANGADNLVVGSGASSEGITIYSGTLGQGSITFADGITGNEAYRGYIAYSHTVDAFQFFTAAQERLRITSAGLVGIGTSAPGSNLEVVGGTSTAGPGAELRLSSADQTIGAADEIIGSVTFKNNDASGGMTGYMAKIDAASNRLFDGDPASGMNLRFFAGTAADGVNTPPERMRITSAGNVGIGTSSIRGTSLLDARGDISFGSNANYYGLLSYNAVTGHIESTSSDGGFKWIRASGPTTSMTLDSSGRLGIGTSSPGSYSYNDLVVAGATGGMSIVTGTTGTGRLVFADGVAGVGAYRGAIQYDHTNDRLEFAADGSARAYLTSTGLGIGTTSPQQPLHVNNAGSSACRLLLQNIGSSAADSTQIWSQNNDIVLNAGSNERARIDSSGRLGIGTSSPDNKLSVGIASADEGVELKATYNGARVARFALLNPGVDNTPYIGSVSGNDFGFITSNTRRMTLDASGRLGIGTTSPLGILQTSINSTDGVGLYLENRADAGSSDAIGLDFLLRRTGGGQFGGTRIRGVKENAWTGTPSTINSALTFSTFKSEVASEKMRIDSSGRLLVGTSTATAGAVDTAAIIGAAQIKSTGLIALSSGGTLDLTLLGVGIVGHLYVTSTLSSNALVRTSSIYFISTRQGNSTAITLLNSDDGSSGGRAFTITNPSGNIFRFTDTSSSACTVSMSFVGGISL